MRDAVILSSVRNTTGQKIRTVSTERKIKTKERRIMFIEITQCYARGTRKLTINTDRIISAEKDSIPHSGYGHITLDTGVDITTLQSYDELKSLLMTK